MTPNCTNCNETDKSGAGKTTASNSGTMPVREREDVVLRFVYEHGIALPPKAIYRGLKLRQNITFSYRTVQNILSRLNNSGEMMRCDKEALDEGRIEPLPDCAKNRRTYYYITEAGIERIAGDEHED